MTLAAGTQLGPYEILSALGAGGMGEVYRARDTRLERTVAIKVLPQHLSSSPEVRQRFEREAKTISQLSHPHICALYDVGQAVLEEDRRQAPGAGRQISYIVMEYLEGETLSARLAKGPLPLGQMLRYGIEIADALDKAHRQGIVHRDLKPGNVMLTKSGVKLLDFGLAKAMAPVSSPSSLTALPTQAPDLTAEGTLLGTLQYMAPEQLEGKEADARTDIFAFGAALYEMTTGRKAFSGASQASLISAIMSSEPPPLSTLQPMTPPALDWVVKTCLAKDPDERWQTANDVKLQLQWIAEGGSAAGLPAPAVARRKTRERLAWGLVTVLCVALAATLAFGVRRRQNVASERITRLSLLPPEKATFIPGTLAVAPDGNRIAFVALTSGGGRLLWVRPLDALEAQPLAGTEGAISPFWSPDSRFIGFFAGGKLKKVEPSGGVPQTVCEVPASTSGGVPGNGRGGTWNRDGTIVFAPNPLTVLHRVSAAGGQPTPLTALDAARKENSHRWPRFLQDGRHFLFFARSRQRENRAIYVGSLDSKVTRRLMPADSNAVFAPPGYLLFLREGTLVTLPFSEKTLQWIGEPIRIAERVRGSDAQYAASFDASEAGVLAYGSGSTASQQLAWFSRDGKRLGSIGPGGNYLDLTLSPDQKRIALDVLDPEVGGRQIWLLDLERDIPSRITSEPWQQQLPIWSPESDRLVFASDREGVFNLAERVASGVGGEKPLLKSSATDLPCDWSPDGRYILFERAAAGPASAPKTTQDPQWWGSARRSLWAMPLSGERKPAPVLQSPFSESQGRFSPDGRRIAYVTDESGRSEVYVETFPVPTGKIRISTQGGSEPVWRRDGKEMFYLAPDRHLMAASVDAGPSRFNAGRPQTLFEVPPEQIGGMRHHYAVTADGQRFLLATIAQESFSPTITVVLNWTAALKK